MAPMKCPTRRRMKDEFEDSYSLTHLARRWGVSRREVRLLLQKGDLPFVQVLGQLRVPTQAVYNYEKSGL